jgi:hypothetical protein
MEPTEFALNLVIELLGGAIQSITGFAALPFLARRRVARRVEDAAAEVIEPLFPFLITEGVSEENQRLLLATCIDELRLLTATPDVFFRASLNGQQVFDKLYVDRGLPAIITEEGLRDVYTLLFPRIATLVCKVPAAVKDWEAEAWSESFRRFDELVNELRALFTRVDELAASPSRHADETLSILRRATAQKIGLEMEVTGLRADRPLAGKFDEFFVHPELRKLKHVKRRKRLDVIRDENAAQEEFVRPDARSVIIGPPGAGKSTWSKWLQRRALTPDWNGLAIRMELRSLTPGKLPSMQDTIRNAAGRHLAEDVTRDKISRWVAGKQVLFILDGFDEVRPIDRDEVAEWIRDLAAAARACPIVLTSRPLTTAHLTELGSPWWTWNIEPFDKSRVINYMTRWYKHVPVIADIERDVDAQALAVAWQDDPTIEPLTGNPLLLSTLLMVHHLDGSLPAGRAQLYRRYVEGMLGLWDDRRKVTATTVHIALEEKRQVLRALALHLFLGGLEQIDETEVISWLTNFLLLKKSKSGADDVLSLLMERSGLINGPGVISFTHKSILEYLVAETILQGIDVDSSGRRIDRFLLFEFRNDDRWNTATFLWAGLAPLADVESFIDQCVDVASLSLAAGLLLDQYERFTYPIKRRLLTKILDKMTPSSEEWLEEQGHAYIVSRSQQQGHIELVIPDMDIRRLKAHASFATLIWRSVEDGTVTWNDAQRHEGRLLELLWMSCLAYPRELNEWSRCISATCPSSATPAFWRFWIVERACKRLAQSEPPFALTDAISIYRQTFPESKAWLPIALLSSTVAISHFAESLTEPSTKWPAAARKILEVLPILDGSGSQEWLAQTYHWVVGFDTKIGDLLAVSSGLVDRIVAAGELPEQELLANIRNALSELIRLRGPEVTIQVPKKILPNE